MEHSGEVDLLEKAKCVRCGKSNANGTKGGRCSTCLVKLKRAKHTPGTYQRAHMKADDALRRQKGKNGTAKKKSSGLGSRKSIVKQTQRAEKKTGQKLSPDRKNNGKGYATSNTRMVPEHLNRGRHHVDGKKLRAWRKRLKKAEIDYDELYTYLLAKAEQHNIDSIATLLRDTDPSDLVSFIKREDAEFSISLETFTKSYVDKYCPLEKSGEASTFKRYEDKYIVPLSFKTQLEDLLNKHLKPDYPSEETKFNSMKSIYFDSSNLDMFKQHLSKSQSRFKIRIREYAPNGVLSKSDFSYLEVKAKNGDVSDKFRIKVPNESIELFKSGKCIPVNDNLTNINPHIAKADLIKRVEDINGAMTTFNLKPSCEVLYTRKAYGSGDFRVTLDEGVNSHALNGFSSKDLFKNDPAMEHIANGYDSSKHAIIEVKHQGEIPNWFLDFMQENNLTKTSFSKYCYSISKNK